MPVDIKNVSSINGYKNFIIPNLTNEQVDEELKVFKAYVNMMQYIAMDLANSYMVDAIYLLKKNGMYKQKTKMLCNKAIEEYEMVERCLNYEIRKKQIILDVLDNGQDAYKGDVDKMYWSFKNVMDKHNVEGSEYKSKIEVALNMLQLSDIIHNDLVRALSIRTGRKFKGLFSNISPNKVFKAWNNVAKHLCLYDLEIANAITNDKNQQLANSIIQKRIVDEDIINNICKISLEQNPDALKEYNRIHQKEISNKAV